MQCIHTKCAGVKKDVERKSRKYVKNVYSNKKKDFVR